MSRSFVHLHCHSHYSLLDGASPIGKLVQRAKDHGMNALALTDHGNLHGALEFYKKAKDKGINPILGYEAYIAPGSRFEKKDAANSKEASYHLTLLAQNRVGFKNLIKLASAAMLEGFYYKPRIDKEILEAHSEGIICLSGCVSSEFSTAILRGGDGEEAFKQAMETAAWFHKLFGDRYFIEIMNNGVDIQRIQLEGAVEIAKRMGLPLVATSDAHYVDRDDAEAQDVMLCVNTGRFRTDTNRMKMENDSFYLRSPEEMYQHFPGLEEAVARSQEIANSVSIDLELGKRHFPVYALPEGRSTAEYLRELCIEGLKERHSDDPEMLKDGVLADVVMARLDRELDVINKLGFPNYFLIVWDFVREARDKGIPATARGSGVGALVCFALYLSHVCPIKYDLLFERFLDLNRKEAPDIDIDFCKERRGLIINYVKEKYGEANVAQIGTFGTLQARAAIKDVGRVLGLPVDRVNKITSLVPEVLHITLEDAIEQSEELKQLNNSDPEVREVLKLALKIEGLARNIGTHAAAVVIADKPLTEYVPLGKVSGKNDIITQWSMGDVEAAGLLKMDFLGLRNLTILSKAEEIIKQTTGTTINPYKFPLDDKKTFALLQRGETKGIFQLESGGIRDLLQKMKPDHFRDIIATNALYRPGPLEGGMVRDYVEVKNGRQQASYIHPVCEKILGETHGVMVYQEQVMRILNELGGIELASSYTCIKAISKKKEELIAKNKDQFLIGCGEKGLAKNDAEDFWNMIIKFAGYGFNKCVVGETKITHALTGEQTTVENLFQNRRDWQIHALGDDFKLRSRRVTDVVWNGRKEVFRVRTMRGAELTATANHPFRTMDGWTNLSDLQIGTRIAAPRELRVDGANHWPRHKLIVLAGLLSEGNTCHPTCLYFYNNHRPFVDDFAEAAAQFPDTVARIDHRRENRFEVCLSTGRDTRFVKGAMPWNAAQLQTAVESDTATLAPPMRSGAYRWAEQLGIVGKKADAKFIPAEVFQLDATDLELFLGRLWAGDGFVGKQGQMPYYATSSRALAAGVQELLLRLGVVSRIHHKTFRYRYQGEQRERPGFTVHLLGKQSVLNFVRRVLPHALGREEQITAFRGYLDQLPPDVTSKDTIPASVRQQVDAARRAKGLGWRELEAQADLSMKEFYGKGSKQKTGFRRSTIGQLGELLECSTLRNLADSDVFWDTIVAIEPCGVQDTYDLTVEHDHNFVANSLIVHNSHSTAYALIAYMTAYLKAHYPVEFMAALLCGDIEGRNFKTKDALVEHLEDCERMGIEVVPPSVNTSDVEFTVGDGKIYFGLSAIKGCGGNAGEAIVAARKKGGPFKDLFDFCERVDSSGASKGVIETLIKAGAFDCFKARRSQLGAIMERAMQAGQSVASDRKSGQKSLFGAFGGEEDAKPAVTLPDLPELQAKEMAQAEKEVLGFYLSSHPLDEYKAKLAMYRSHTVMSAKTLPEKQEVILGGMLAALKYGNSKDPKPGMPSRWVMFDLEDVEGGVIRCTMWPSTFAEYGQLVAPDAIVMARGRIDRRGGEEANLNIDELMTLAAIDERSTSGIEIRFDERQHGPETVKKAYEIIRGYPANGEKPGALKMQVVTEDRTLVDLRVPKFRLNITKELEARLQDLLGAGYLRLLKSPPKPSADRPKPRFQKAGAR